VAVTVIVLSPATSGTLAAVHAVVPLHAVGPVPSVSTSHVTLVC
jgi:hypothetical protein